ncbi:hypothetical protein B0T24DRAFT_620327 [Lasiosphaeria ovina]|uniref:Uncharacterized protein n=1 Tax=Lasiosphaeria ovina TaxID=92902 RepID=A0AAE0KIX6_9PEZI|nr:hypothetical protein B0T24DRAFT_620327 [Lasiosphaeria ovina]
MSLNAGRCSFEIKVVTLLGPSNLRCWEASLYCSLEAMRLEEYIEDMVGEPADDHAKEQWRSDRAFVKAVIYQSLSQPVQEKLAAYGWNPRTEKDPYVLFVLIKRVAPLITQQAAWSSIA